MRIVGFTNVVMKKVIKTTLGYVSIRFYLKNLKKTNPERGRVCSIGLRAAKIRREEPDAKFAFRQQVHLAS